MTTSNRTTRGFSLVELLASLTILGILAMVAIPRIIGSSAKADRSACDVNQGEIELQAQLWFRNKGSWPAANLSDIGADPDYFPEGLPNCPVDGSNYTLDANRHDVSGHNH